MALSKSLLRILEKNKISIFFKKKWKFLPIIADLKSKEKELRIRTKRKKKKIFEFSKIIYLYYFAPAVSASEFESLKSSKRKKYILVLVFEHLLLHEKTPILIKYFFLFELWRDSSSLVLAAGFCKFFFLFQISIRQCWLNFFKFQKFNTFKISTNTFPCTLRFSQCLNRNRPRERVNLFKIIHVYVFLLLKGKGRRQRRHCC